MFVGPRSGTVEALLKVAKSRSGAVLSKSSTLVKQSGSCTSSLARMGMTYVLGIFFIGTFEPVHDGASSAQQILEKPKKLINLQGIHTLGITRLSSGSGRRLAGFVVYSVETKYSL